MSEKFINMLHNIGTTSTTSKGNIVLTLDSTGYRNMDFIDIENIYGYKVGFIQTDADDLHISFKRTQSGVSDPIQSAKEIVAQISNGNHHITHFYNKKRLESVNIELETNCKLVSIDKLTQPYGFTLLQTRFNQYNKSTNCSFRWGNQ